MPERFQPYALSESPQPVIAAQLQKADKAESFYLFGPYGTGKTGLAVGYLKRWLDTYDRPALFVSAPRLFAELRNTYDDREASELAVIDRYARVPLLVLDDLGSESFKSADWLSDRLYLILGERHDELRPTVITSNLSLRELESRVGERVTWRISEACGPGHIMEVRGKNLRAAL